MKVIEQAFTSKSTQSKKNSTIREEIYFIGKKRAVPQ